jgi:ATP-dependent Clp protease, protease subunit
LGNGRIARLPSLAAGLERANNVADPDQRLPSTVYAVYCAGIEQATAQKIVQGITVAIGAKVQSIHAMWQSSGGFVGDGVFLYEFFRSMPIELTLYNVGQISSAGIIAYLGGKYRKTTARATFMIHRSTNSPQFATAAKLKRVAKSLVLDDQRTETILRRHIKLPDQLWDELDYHDLYLSGEEAVAYGLAHEIADFAPPAGTQVFNLIA